MRPLPAGLALTLLAAGPPDSIDAFHFEPTRVETGIALVYTKSNVDGSHAGSIAWYWPDADWIESFKWSEGQPEATLVRARMDWKTFSVSHFETYSVDADGARTPRFTMESEPENRRLAIEVQGQSMECSIEHYPWHSYDFDFASLVRVLPHLIDPEGSVELGRADAVREPEPHFAYLGPITVAFGAEEEHEGTACRRYDVDGPGLEDRGGCLWIERATGRLVDYEIELPDEPGFESGKMKLERAEPVTPERWQEFLRTRTL